MTLIHLPTTSPPSLSTANRWGAQPESLMVSVEKDPEGVRGVEENCRRRRRETKREREGIILLGHSHSPEDCLSQTARQRKPIHELNLRRVKSLTSDRQGHTHWGDTSTQSSTFHKSRFSPFRHWGGEMENRSAERTWKSTHTHTHTHTCTHAHAHTQIHA